jgi:hypothetical protein
VLILGFSTVAKPFDRRRGDCGDIFLNPVTGERVCFFDRLGLNRFGDLVYILSGRRSTRGYHIFSSAVDGRRTLRTPPSPFTKERFG